MSRPVEITVCDVGIFLETYHVKDIVPVGDLPGIDVSGIFLSVIPQK